MITIQRFLFKNYPVNVKISDSIRETYYKLGDKIPKKYEGLTYELSGNKKVLVDMWGNPIVKNKKSAGTSRYNVINGQELYSLSIHPSTRNKIVKQLKEYYNSYNIEFIKCCKPILINFVFYNNNLKADLDNHALFYVKTFIDFIQKNQFVKQGVTEAKNNYIIENDNTDYLIGYSVRYKKLNENIDYKILNIENMLEITIKQEE